MSTAPTRRKTLEKTVSNEPVSTAKFQCYRCGMQFGARRKFFPVSHSPLYRGTSYLPFCSECVDKMYDDYVNELGDQRAAMKRMCMKLDLYWCDALYDMAEKSAVSHSRVRTYIAKSNLAKYIDKTYDDTIREEDRAEASNRLQLTTQVDDGDLQDLDADQEVEVDIADDIKTFWGPGYTPKMYLELEDRRKFWEQKFPEGYTFGMGEEALLRQICSLEIDINHDRAAGKSVDKPVNTLNSLLGSLNIKPVQKKEDIDASVANTPLGVWLYKYENKRPLPEIDEELKDVNGLKKYIFTWMGHLCKMLGKKNGYTRLYEEEIERLRVAKPEYQDEDDESLIYDSYSGDEP